MLLLQRDTVAFVRHCRHPHPVKEQRSAVAHVSTRVGYQLNAIAGAAALGAHHTPGAIERPVVVLQDVARVDAPQGDCQSVQCQGSSGSPEGTRSCHNRSTNTPVVDSCLLSVITPRNTTPSNSLLIGNAALPCARRVDLGSLGGASSTPFPFFSRNASCQLQGSSISNFPLQAHSLRFPADVLKNATGGKGVPILKGWDSECSCSVWFSRLSN